MKEVSPAELAQRVGSTPQHIRRLCGPKDEPAMPGARWDGKRWRINARKAKPWVLKRQNAPRVAGRQPIEIAPIDFGVASELPTGGAGTLQIHEALVDQVRQLSAIVSGIRERMAKGQVDQGASRVYKELSSELREMVKLARTEEDLAERLMPRDEHRRAIEALARLVVQEIRGMPRDLPDAVLEGLAGIGMEPKNPRKALDVLADVTTREVNATMDRVAKFIREARNGRAR